MLSTLRDEDIAVLQIHSIRTLASSEKYLELLHQVLPHGPHPCSLAINVHGNTEKHASQLDASNR